MQNRGGSGYSSLVVRFSALAVPFVVQDIRNTPNEETQC
jgi:hypothetical protein